MSVPDVAAALHADETTVDFITRYWVLKRKVVRQNQFYVLK